MNEEEERRVRGILPGSLQERPLTLADLEEHMRNSRLNQEILGQFAHMLTQPSPWDQLREPGTDPIMERLAERAPDEQLIRRQTLLPSMRRIPSEGEVVQNARIIVEEVQLQRVVHRTDVTFEALEEEINELRTHGRDGWRGQAYRRLHEAGAPRGEIRTLLDRYLIEMDQPGRDPQDAVSFALRYAALLIIAGRQGVYESMEGWESVTFEYVTSAMQRAHQCIFHGLARQLRPIAPGVTEREIIDTGITTQTRRVEQEIKVGGEAPRRLKVRKRK
jgi:hypothetical protein